MTLLDLSKDKNNKKRNPILEATNYTLEKSLTIFHLNLTFGICETTEPHFWSLKETVRLLIVQSHHNNKHLNVCSSHSHVPTQRLLLHRSLEKWEVKNLNKLNLIL